MRPDKVCVTTKEQNDEAAGGDVIAVTMRRMVEVIMLDTILLGGWWWWWRSRCNADYDYDGWSYDYSNGDDKCDDSVMVASAVSSANYQSIQFLYPFLLCRVTGGLERFPACIRWVMRGISQGYLTRYRHGLTLTPLEFLIEPELFLNWTVGALRCAANYFTKFKLCFWLFHILVCLRSP